MQIPPQQNPGNGLMQGMGALGMGLDALSGMGGGAKGPDADLAGYNAVKPGGMVDVGGGQMLPNPNGQTYDASGNPIGPVASFPNWWQRNFGWLSR